MKRTLRMVLLIFVLVGAMGMNCFASGLAEDQQNVFIEDYDDIYDLYDGADGTYIERVSDELTMQYNVVTEAQNNLVKSRASSTKSTSKTIHSTLFNSSNQVVWKSTLTATYKYNGTYVWCTSGITYFNTDLGSTRTLTKNTYSSAKVTGNSYYRVDSTIYTSSYGVYYLHEYICCDKAGNLSSNSYYNR